MNPINVARQSDATGGRHLMAAVFTNIAGSLLTALAGLGATTYLARQLSVAEFGSVLLLLTVITGFAIFEGQRSVVIHRVAAQLDQPGFLFRAAARINAAMIVVTLAILMTALFLGWGASLTFGSELALSATVVAFFIVMQYWTFLDAEQQTVFTGISRSLAWIILYAGFCAAAFLRLGPSYYAFAILGMHILLAALLVARFYALGLGRKYSSRGQSLERPGLLAPALNNIVFNGCAVTMNVADRAIAATFLGMRSAGLYAGPSELALRAVGLVRAGVQVILPWAARLSPGHQQRYWLLSVATIVLFVGTGVSSLLYWRSELVVLLLGPKFGSSGDLLGIFLLGILLTTIGYACILHLNAQGNFTLQRKLYTVGAAVLLVGAYLGARAGSLPAIGLAFLAGRSVDLIMLGVLLRSCPKRATQLFLGMAAGMGGALAAAWQHHAVIAIAMISLAGALCHILVVDSRKAVA